MDQYQLLFCLKQCVQSVISSHAAKYGSGNLEEIGPSHNDLGKNVIHTHTYIYIYVCNVEGIVCPVGDLIGRVARHIDWVEMC